MAGFKSIFNESLSAQLLEPRHDEWNGIQTEDPLKVQHGGIMHPTDFKFIDPGAAAGTTYTAGGNLSWLNPFWTACSVPIIHSAIQTLVMGKFKEPKALDVVAAVSPQSDVRNERHRHSSLLKRLSPEDEHLAYILATWRDVSKDENVEDMIGLISTDMYIITPAVQ